MGSLRLAMHGDETYDRQAHNLADQIDLLEMPKMTDEEVLANWRNKLNDLRSALKRVGRMKKGGRNGRSL